MKSCHEKSQLRLSSEERTGISPGSLLPSSRAHRPWQACPAALLPAAQGSSGSTFTLTFPSPETWLLQLQSTSSQWRKCVQATRLKITVWVGVEWEFWRKCLLLLKRELTSPLSLRARGKWDTKCQLKTSGTTMLQPEPKFLLQPLQVQT